jgi:imidazole glycerol-phosphate synthase subunit HisF
MGAGARPASTRSNTRCGWPNSDRDGTRDGYDLDFIRTVADQVTVPVVASGGVGNLGHLVDGIRDGHASAVLAASIFHFGEATIAEAHQALAAAGIPVRG